MRKRGFSLTELVIVLAVIAILSTLAVPSYRKAVQRTEDKEAAAMEQLILEAEDVYYSEYNTYATCETTAECNTDLDLHLPVGTWNYKVTLADGEPTVSATSVSSGRVWEKK